MTWSWNTVLLYLAVGGMQGSWLTLALLILFKKLGADSLPWSGILLFYPISFILNLSFLNWQRVRKYSLIFCAGAGLIGYAGFMAFLMISGSMLPGESGLTLIWQSINPYHPGFLLLVTAGVLWGLGCRLGSLRVSFTTLLSEFQFGLVILLLALFAEQKLEMHQTHLVPLILCFFSFALLGAGVAHGREHAGWTSSRYLSSWIAFLVIAIALILITGLLITVLVSPSFIQFLLALLYQAGSLLLGFLAKILRFLINLLPLPDSTLPVSAPVPRPAPKPEDWSPFFLISDSTREVMRVLWTLMVSSLLAVALWRVSSQVLDWLRRRMGTLAGEEVEPLPGAFRADLRILLTWILDILSLKWLYRLLRKKKRSEQKINSIRQIYMKLLQWSAARGCGREVAQTPYEFLPRMCANLPEAKEDFVFLTSQYVAVRYGPKGTAEEVFEEAKSRLQNIREIEARQKKRKKKDLER